MVYVAYTEQEIHAANTLYDLAVKSAGLQVAEAALVLSRKLQSGIPEEQITVSVPKPPASPEIAQCDTTSSVS